MAIVIVVSTATVVIAIAAAVVAISASIVAPIVATSRVLFAHVTSPEAFYGSVVPVPVTALPTMRKATIVSKAWIVVPVYMAAETIVAVIPGTRAYEHPI